MKTVRILQYLPVIGDGHAIDNIIDLWTHIFNPKVPDALRCSHIEIWFPHEDIFGHLIYFGECYTSTMRGKEENGVVMRPASEVLTHPERWDYFEIQLDDTEYKDLYGFCCFRAKLGLKYGKLTIFGRAVVVDYSYVPVPQLKTIQTPFQTLHIIFFVGVLPSIFAHCHLSF